MRKVLIINDHFQLNDAIETLLKLKGFQTKSILSDADIYLHLDNYKPEVVILNAVLKGMDSFNICARLRKGDSERTKIILFGNASANKKRFKPFNAHGFLDSPFETSLLVNLVEN